MDALARVVILVLLVVLLIALFGCGQHEEFFPPPPIAISHGAVKETVHCEESYFRVGLPTANGRVSVILFARRTFTCKLREEADR